MIDGERVGGVVGFEASMGVPSAGSATAMLNLDEANTAFHESPGDEELFGVVLVSWSIDAVETKGLGGFLTAVDDLRDGVLHTISEFVGGDAGLEVGIVRRILESQVG